MKRSNPFILNKSLCTVTIKAISVLAILQRKIIVFSFSQCLPQLSQGYFVSFRTYDRLGKEGRVPQQFNFNPLLE